MDVRDAGLVHELFEQHARRAPHALALTYRDQQLSYGELDARANRLARQLVELGVGPESVVGVLLERAPPMITALLDSRATPIAMGPPNFPVGAMVSNVVFRWEYLPGSNLYLPTARSPGVR